MTVLGLHGTFSLILSGFSGSFLAAGLPTLVLVPYSTWNTERERPQAKNRASREASYSLNSQRSHVH